MIQAIDDIRCMLIPMHMGRLLLPNAAVAEIIGFREPEPIADAAVGDLGRVHWRQRELPVIDFERLLGGDEQAPGIRQRIAVCYAPDPQGRWPLLGMLAQGIPRLLRLNRDAIEDATSGPQGESAVKFRVTVAGEPLTVPNLDFLQTHFA